MSTKDGKMETRMFLCFHVKNLHESTKTCMYFLHLELTFTPHYIITDKGLLMYMICVLTSSHCAYSANYSNNCVIIICMNIGHDLQFESRVCV